MATANRHVIHESEAPVGYESVKGVTDIRLPYRSKNFLSYWVTVSFSKWTLFQGDVRCTRKIIEVMKMRCFEE